jgi:hypothetical protein
MVFLTIKKHGLNPPPQRVNTAEAEAAELARHCKITAGYSPFRMIYYDLSGKCIGLMTSHWKGPRLATEGIQEADRHQLERYGPKSQPEALRKRECPIRQGQ